jgi:hypothetical protein
MRNEEATASRSIGLQENRVESSIKEDVTVTVAVPTISEAQVI